MALVRAALDIDLDHMFKELYKLNKTFIFYEYVTDRMHDCDGYESCYAGGTVCTITRFVRQCTTTFDRWHIVLGMAGCTLIVLYQSKQMLV